MRVWIDAQLPPALAAWLSRRFGVEAAPLRDLGLRDAEDTAIFHAARDAGAVILTKDSDFLAILEHHGPPPQVVWVTVGNTSNRALQYILETTWPTVASLLTEGEALVEITGHPTVA